jgi:hypothetical protein
MSAETNATHTRFAKVPKRGTAKCRSATNANTNPANASHLGNTPVPNTTSEVVGCDGSLYLSHAKLPCALSVSLLFEGVQHPFRDNILGPRVYEALFKAALNVFRATAMPFLVPWGLPTNSRGLGKPIFTCAVMPPLQPPRPV